MHSIGDEKHLFVVCIGVILNHIGKSIPGETARVCLFPVDHQHSAADLITIMQNGLIEERHTVDHMPNVVGIQTAGVIATLSFVIVILILLSAKGDENSNHFVSSVHIV